MSGRSGSFKRKRIPEYQGTGKRFKAARKSTVSNLTRKVNKILSEQERKNFDVAATVTTVGNTAQIIQLNSITQGDDATSRDGRKVAMVSSQMRYSISGLAAGSSDGYRIIVLVDKQSNGITPVAADILTVANNIRSPLTMDFKERFRVIHDNYSGYKKGDYQLGGASESQFPCQYFYKYPDEMAQSEFGAIGNIPTSGSLVMLILTEQANTFAYYHRARFTDT